MEISKPLLTELTTKYYIKNSLKTIRDVKNKYITIFVNIILFILFFLVFGLLLYYRYKGQLTIEEKNIKEKEKKQYLFEKLHKISYEKHKEQKDLITDLPII
tara:strand:+ start:203 stop:508 length:306 start_codon:yes stop_codon:yes gene_type:complete